MQRPVSFAVLLALLPLCFCSPLCPGGDNAILHFSSSNCSASVGGEVATLAVCTAAWKTAPGAHGLIIFTPVSRTKYTFTDGSFRGAPQTTFDCTTATGKAKPEAQKPKQAALQLWRDSSRESFLKATGPNTVELRTFQLFQQGAPLTCSTIYTVTKGCLLGAKAKVPAPAIKCPTGTATKKGLGGVKFCEPCVGSTYAAAGAKSCTPCPPEHKLATLPAALRAQCPSCLAKGTCFSSCNSPQEYTNPASGQCKACPQGSWPTPDYTGCAMCIQGRRCCTVNHSPACPPCKTGATGKELSFTVVATGITGQAWEKCEATSVYQCYQKMRITVLPTCQISLSPTPRPSDVTYLSTLDARPLAALTAGQTSTCDGLVTDGVLPMQYAVVNSGGFDVRRDIIAKVFKKDFYGTTAGATMASASGPYFQVQWPNTTCKTTFRALEATNPAALHPIKPDDKCPPANKECRRPCPRGSYISDQGGIRLCLPCPSGTFSSQADTSTCQTCGSGQIAFGVGNTECTRCPAGTQQRGTQCSECYNGWSSEAATDCTYCWGNTTAVLSGCISTDGTRLCCDVGQCKGVDYCPNGNPPGPKAVPALFKLATKTPACNSYPLLGCLGSTPYLYIRMFDDYTASAMGVLKGPWTGPNCSQYNAHNVVGLTVRDTDLLAFNTYLGTTDYVNFIGTAKVNPTGRLDITMWQTQDAMRSSTPPAAVCQASFNLESGWIMGVKKAAAACPKGLLPTTLGGVKSCKSCEPGNYIKGGQCVRCPNGTYNGDFDSASCTPCPAGQTSDGTFSAPTYCSACSVGTVPDGTKKQCTSCKPNTFARFGAARCTACPAGTTTNGQSSAGFCRF